MNTLEQFTTPSASYTLKRLPEIANNTLRAWDAADELLTATVFSDAVFSDMPSDSADYLSQTDKQSLLIINDTFGALTLAFHKKPLHNWSDSFISHLAAAENLKQNNIEISDSISFIPATEELNGQYKLVIIKIPKTLALLEDQLHRLKAHINKDTKIIAAAMTKHIHNSTVALFESIIGTTTTSRATKKARLIFAENNATTTGDSPYPNTISDEKIPLCLVNYANVFSKDKLDVGTRFLIQNMHQCPVAEHVIDIGCGNGALGIMLKRYQPKAKVSFIDESYNAVASAKESYAKAYPESATDASFKVSNVLEQLMPQGSVQSTQQQTEYSSEHNPEQQKTEKAQLVLCNPPFHQVHSLGDHIAWEMFKQSREVLATDGEIWIVGNRHLAYHIKLKKVFGNCRTIATNPKFVILAAKKLDKLNRARK